MQVLNPGFDLDAFFDGAARAPSRILLLDYDGTLAPFRVNPAEAVPYPGVPEAIEAIVQSRSTRVVIVSGRPAREVPPLLTPSPAPEIWGAHGWERLTIDGRLELQTLPAEARSALDGARDAAKVLVARGARLEEKRASVALHWRGLSEAIAGEIRREAADAWARFVTRADLEILPFDGGLELRARGFTKASAVNAILAETHGDSAIAYLGDDITDEDAFRAVKGRGVGVLVRQALRATEADVWLEPPDELLEFLGRWREMC